MKLMMKILNLKLKVERDFSLIILQLLSSRFLLLGYYYFHVA